MRPSKGPGLQALISKKKIKPRAFAMTVPVEPVENTASSTTPLGQSNKHVGATQNKYDEEREKRLQSSAATEYLDLYSLDRFRHFKSDPWGEQEGSNPNAPAAPHDGSKCEILIIGAGWSGLMTAVKLLQAGVRLEDMRIVDFAGGFGGTWCKLFLPTSAS